jgi:peptidyl-prolyl cis-trans isomerase D
MSGPLPRKRHPLAVALMGLLMLVFLILGVSGSNRLGDIFAGTRGDAVIIAGQHMVSTREFKRIFEQQRRNYEEQTHQPLSLDALVQSGGDQQLLDGMAQDRAFSEMLRRSGVTPADALVEAEIKRQPAFFDRVTGKFSPEQFTRALGEAGLTPRDLQSGIKDELAQHHFIYAMNLGFRAPRIYTALNAVRGLENRDVSYFTLAQGAVPQPAPPTDAQLLAFMKEHADQLRVPEMRVITLALFSAKALAPTMTPDAAAVQKEFEFKKDSLSNPETRSLVQIPVKTAAQGAQAAAQLAHGVDPAAVAKAVGAEPITYADKPASAIADRKLAAAAFALRNGEAKGPIQGDLGLAAVKVTGVTPGVVATLESARPQIEAELRVKTAEDRVYDMTTKFDEARQSGASVADAARQAGVAAVTVGPVTANGMDTSGQRNPLLTDKILKSAFEQSQGGETDLEEADRGESYALKVEKVIPSALPALADKRAELAAAYMRTEFIKALRAKVETLIARIKKGESIDVVAASVGGHVTHQVGLQAVTAQQHQDLGREFLGRLFEAKPGDAFAASGQQGIFVARLDAVRPGDVTTMARIVENIRPRVSEEFVRDLNAAVQGAAAKTVKVSTNIDLARRALGVDTSTLPKPGAKPGAAPASKSGGPAQ